MTYRVFIRTAEGDIPSETKTITPDQGLASEAFATLVKHRELDGQQLAAVVTYDNRTLASHRFDRSPGDADYWRGRLSQIEWPKVRPNYNEHRASKRSFQANLKPDENSLVTAIKIQRGVTTDRELLLLLCNEENARIEHNAQ